MINNRIYNIGDIHILIHKNIYTLKGNLIAPFLCCLKPTWMEAVWRHVTVCFSGVESTATSASSLNLSHCREAGCIKRAFNDVLCMHVSTCLAVNKTHLWWLKNKSVMLFFSFFFLHKEGSLFRAAAFMPDVWRTGSRQKRHPHSAEILYLPPCR